MHYALNDGAFRMALTDRLRATPHKPKLADTLIAQTCIDHEATLINRDAGFKAFARHGLQLF